MTVFVLSSPTSSEPATAPGDTIILMEGAAVTSGGNAALQPADNVNMVLNGVLHGSRGFTSFNAGDVTVGVTGLVTAFNLHAAGFNGTQSPSTLTNHGVISGLNTAVGVEIRTTSGTNIVHNMINTGSITASGNNAIAISSELGTGSIVTINNTGTIGTSSAQPAIQAGDGIERISNAGQIFGAVRLAGGNDLYDGAGGNRVTGTIFGETGNDTLRGGNFNDSLDGGDNDDALAGRGGSDRLLGGNGNDELFFDADDLRFGAVDGGTGYDTGHYGEDETPLSINLTAQQLEAYFGSAADEMVVCGTLGGFGGFIRMGAGNDLVDGSGQGDNIDGGTGIDVLYGRGGLDDLAGGLGGDWLQGGAGADMFRYNALTDSTVNGQDFIADFSTAEGDKINLTNALAGLPAATFNTGFGTGTSVYVFAGGGGTSLVQVYTAATLQMQIVVSQASLAASDFVL